MPDVLIFSFLRFLRRGSRAQPSHSSYKKCAQGNRNTRHKCCASPRTHTHTHLLGAHTRTATFILLLTQEACRRLGSRPQDLHTSHPAHALLGEITFYPTLAGPVILLRSQRKPQLTPPPPNQAFSTGTEGGKTENLEQQLNYFLAL